MLLTPERVIVPAIARKTPSTLKAVNHLSLIQNNPIAIQEETRSAQSGGVAAKVGKRRS